MKSSVLLSICSTGFAVSFVHSILPTHWLPFVLASRGQKWTVSKTMGITALASAGHTLFTVALGLLVLGLGTTVERWTGQIFPWIAGLTLAGFGSYYLLRPAGGHHHHGHGHAHAHGPGEPPHDHGHPHVLSVYQPPRTAPASDRAVVIGLLAMLALSPCEAFLPVYLTGVSHGWWGFVVLSFVLAAGCMGGMLLFTGLGLLGLQRFNAETLEQYEDYVVGGLLLLLAVLVVALEA